MKMAVLSLPVAAGRLFSGWCELVVYAMIAGFSVNLVPVLLLSLLAHLSCTEGL